ncbi:hypothetical protein [Hyphomicrobium sp.]|uniref:hypothetical protein n=1 Tax=Hyphomicrobium sp. TaxID=82 RepID=UPI001DA633AC|nr:hypothetical protein [Hyphomicrobium sp.]MBY0561453.1 hypothetical protein [Hyphomicrobium sp.]
MTRIHSLDLSTMDVIVKLAGGNPGAAIVLTNILKETASIDPDNVMGGIGAVLFLDTLEIYEEKIWMLYKYVCGSSTVKTIAALRAVQLGLKSRHQLLAAIDGKAEAFNADEALKLVKERLPDFAKQEAA